MTNQHQFTRLYIAIALVGGLALSGCQTQTTQSSQTPQSSSSSSSTPSQSSSSSSSSSASTSSKSSSSSQSSSSSKSQSQSQQQTAEESYGKRQSSSSQQSEEIPDLNPQPSGESSAQQASQAQTLEDLQDVLDQIEAQLETAASDPTTSDSQSERIDAVLGDLNDLQTEVSESLLAPSSGGQQDIATIEALLDVLEELNTTMGQPTDESTPTDSQDESTEIGGNVTEAQLSTLEQLLDILGTGSQSTAQSSTETGVSDEASSSDEELTALDDQLNASLGEFDGMILNERTAAAQGEPGEFGTDEEDEGRYSASELEEESLFEEGDLASTGADQQGNSTGSGDDQESGQGQQGDSRSGRRGVPGAQQTAHAAIPDDIPDGSDDDIVARQIREAAMKEQDPVLREKLWEEYRKYKNR